MTAKIRHLDCVNDALAAELRQIEKDIGTGTIEAFAVVIVRRQEVCEGREVTASSSWVAVSPHIERWDLVPLIGELADLQHHVTATMQEQFPGDEEPAPK